MAALEAFAEPLARYDPKILSIDLALLRAATDDPDVAVLVEQGTQMWHDGCRRIVQQLDDEGQLASPWTVDTATDLLWSFMFPRDPATADRRPGMADGTVR